MATVIPEHQFPLSKCPKYPWKFWMNGETWRLESGTDFCCEPRSFVTLAYAYAKKNGMKIQTQVMVEGGRGVVYLRAKPATGEPEKKTIL